MHDWQLQNKEVGEKIISPDFIVNDSDQTKFNLAVYPGGITNRHSGFVSVELFNKSPDNKKGKI